jgi:hypothetical protein
MNMKKILTVLTILVLLFTGLVGCATDTESSTPKRFKTINLEIMKTSKNGYKVSFWASELVDSKTGKRYLHIFGNGGRQLIPID